MVQKHTVEEQLKKIHFKTSFMGAAEVHELPNILMQDEIIHECVNGYYEGGFALLVATNIRLLLIDKKPLNFLTVEDLRFDLINQIDYSHRMFGAQISISTGSKNLKFRSYNQPRLRKLINTVQDGMANTKKQQANHQVDQNQHLEQINQQLQAYLLAQHTEQEALRKQLQAQINGAKDAGAADQPVLTNGPKPSPRLNDYLLAQRLMEQVKQTPQSTPQASPAQAITSDEPTEEQQPQMADLYSAGMQEIFGRQTNDTAQSAATSQQVPTVTHPLEINALKIAYSKLPMALRNRRFGIKSTSFTSHRIKTVLPSNPTTTGQ